MLKISKNNKYISHSKTIFSENCLKYADILWDFPLRKASLDIIENYKIITCNKNINQELLKNTFLKPLDKFCLTEKKSYCEKS